MSYMTDFSSNKIDQVDPQCVKHTSKIVINFGSRTWKSLQLYCNVLAQWQWTCMQSVKQAQYPSKAGCRVQKSLYSLYTKGTRTHNITHVRTLTKTNACFVWGLVESHGGLYSRMSFHCGKGVWHKRGTFNGNSFLYSFHDLLNSSTVKYETFLKALLMVGRNFAVPLYTLWQLL